MANNERSPGFARARHNVQDVEACKWGIVLDR